MKAICKICKKEIVSNNVKDLWNKGKKHYLRKHKEKWGRNNPFKIEK